MNRRLLIKIRRSILYRYRFSIFISGFIAFVFLSSFYFIYNIPGKPKSTDINNIYNTWKIVKYYKNGKLVLDNRKIENRRFVVYPNGTYKWVNLGAESDPLPCEISKDGSQLILDNVEVIENIHTIYELSPTRLRFGKRNILSHYEYVMVPFDFKVE
jgi:hypothetical protein